MSWKFGGVYIKPGFENPEEALRFLHIDKRFTYETLPFSELVNTSFMETAIGVLKGVTLVQDNLLPYNNSSEAGKNTDADFKMMELSKKQELVVFFLDGTTESYLFKQFKNGQCSRMYSVQQNELWVEEGKFSETDTKSQEQKMIHWLEAFTGLSFKALLEDKQTEFYLFTDTGF